MCIFSEILHSIYSVFEVSENNFSKMNKIKACLVRSGSISMKYESILDGQAAAPVYQIKPEIMVLSWRNLSIENLWSGAWGSHCLLLEYTEVGHLTFIRKISLSTKHVYRTITNSDNEKSFLGLHQWSIVGINKTKHIRNIVKTSDVKVNGKCECVEWMQQRNIFCKE